MNTIMKKKIYLLSTVMMLNFENAWAMREEDNVPNSPRITLSTEEYEMQQSILNSLEKDVEEKFIELRDELDVNFVLLEESKENQYVQQQMQFALFDYFEKKNTESEINNRKEFKRVETKITDEIENIEKEVNNLGKQNNIIQQQHFTFADYLKKEIQKREIKGRKELKGVEKKLKDKIDSNSSLIGNIKLQSNIIQDHLFNLSDQVKKENIKRDIKDSITKRKLKEKIKENKQNQDTQFFWLLKANIELHETASDDRKNAEIRFSQLQETLRVDREIANKNISQISEKIQQGEIQDNIFKNRNEITYLTTTKDRDLEKYLEKQEEIAQGLEKQRKVFSSNKVLNEKIEQLRSRQIQKKIFDDKPSNKHRDEEIERLKQENNMLKAKLISNSTPGPNGQPRN